MKWWWILGMLCTGQQLVLPIASAVRTVVWICCRTRSGIIWNWLAWNWLLFRSTDMVCDLAFVCETYCLWPFELPVLKMCLKILPSFYMPSLILPSKHWCGLWELLAESIAALIVQCKTAIVRPLEGPFSLLLMFLTKHISNI